MSDVEISDAVSTAETDTVTPSATGSHITVNATSVETSPPRKKVRKNTRKRTTKQVTLNFSAVFLDLLKLRILSSNPAKQPIPDPADPTSLLRPLGFQRHTDNKSPSPSIASETSIDVDSALQESNLLLRTIDGLPARKTKGKSSWVHEHGKLQRIDNEVYWVCSLCTNRSKPHKYIYRHGTKNIRDHLEGKMHRLTEFGENESEQSVYAQQLEASLAQSFVADQFRELLLRWISTAHLPFATVENEQFQAMMDYASPALRCNDVLPASGVTVRSLTMKLFLLYQATIITLLSTCATLIHISFDLWTSPNKYSMLGIVCHYTDKSFKAKTVLLGMKRLFGPHSGANMGQLLIRAIKTYKIGDRLGFAVIDNAGDNDTALVSVQEYLQSQNITWSGPAHRLRCFGHVVNLIMKAFLANKPLKAQRNRRDPITGKKTPWVRPFDAVTKLHTIIVFIMWTGQRIDNFMALTQFAGEDMLRPVKENDTRWFSTYMMISRAIKLKDTIDLFVRRYRGEAKDGKTLGDFKMSSDDWNYCIEVLAFMKPFYNLMERLEGKSESGMSHLPPLFSDFPKIAVLSLGNQY
jgi:hypothetical protein